MKKILFLILLSIPIAIRAQSVTLDMCMSKAINYSTLQAQRDIQSDIAISSKKGFGSSYIPQADFNAQLSYQSDVISIPINIPGQHIPVLSKDQYRATIDLQQLIYDGGYMVHQKRVVESNLYAEQSRLDISESALKDRVSTIYLGILLIDEKLRIINVTLNDLNNNVGQLENSVKQGVALRSNLDILTAEKLRLEQHIIESQCSREQLIQMLSSMIGEQISPQCSFVQPTFEEKGYTHNSNRPEYQLFEAQQKQIEAQVKVVNSKNMPKLYAFATAGYGLPGLNMLKNEFESMFIIGAKLSVPLTKWATTKQENRTLASRRRLVEQQQLEFSRTNDSEISNQIIEIQKFKRLIETDSEIVAKQSEVVASQEQRLQNGVITSNDYITDLNAMSQSLLNQKLHEIELLQAQIKYNSLIGLN